MAPWPREDADADAAAGLLVQVLAGAILVSISPQRSEII
jgi:hypothetical protein